MATRVLIGGQWGDEGKGKIVDVLTEKANWIARFQGGNNAGHTVKVGDKKYVLHLIPSGILRDGKTCILGNGCVIDPAGFLQELAEVHDGGIDTTGRLWISDRAQLALPYHKALDGAREARNNDEAVKIGTTKRGIGPAYMDKMQRTGLRAGDILEDDFEERLRQNLIEHNQLLKLHGQPELDPDTVVPEVLAATEQMKSMITDTTQTLNAAVSKGESVLFEGAQGTMLDIDHGSYPFVTSSNTTSGGAATGTGIPPNKIQDVIGVVKAYTTRVGEGPFPTELFDDLGAEMARVGDEFGATTGRARRCGWFDAVVARYAVMVNGINWWAVTKLDVLDGFETIKICVAYDVNGERVENLPGHIRKFAACKPIYEEMPGWNCPTTQARTWEDLPENCKAYIKRLEELSGAPAGFVSVGPKRDETILTPSAPSDLSL
ncbi:adenylosuccinate synthase [Kiritimatiellaeota bacterium B1221]|nr:adenylosuccinate synthase [Kiritimatiellaeota bacterium B1221]